MEAVRRLLQIVEWAAYALLPILSAARYADPNAHQDPAKAILRFLSGWSLGLIFWLSAGGLVFKIVNQWILDQYLTTRKEIKHILDSLQKNYFHGVPEEDLYKHRVTLFKACKAWKSLFNRRPTHLKIFSRSGTAFQKSCTWFPIDDEREEGNEGLAGRAWFINGQVTVTDLPAWPENPGHNPKEDPACREYSIKGFISSEKASQLMIKSRSLFAIVVRKPSGQRWGVLIYDSRDPLGISITPEKKALVAQGADLLNRMVKGGPPWVS